MINYWYFLVNYNISPLFINISFKIGLRSNEINFARAGTVFVLDLDCTIIKRIQEPVLFISTRALYSVRKSRHREQADTLTRAYIRRQTSVGGQSVIDGSNRVVQWSNGTLRAWRPVYPEIFRGYEWKRLWKTDLYVLSRHSSIVDHTVCEMKVKQNFWCKNWYLEYLMLNGMAKNIKLIFYIWKIIDAFIKFKLNFTSTFEVK